MTYDIGATVFVVWLGGAVLVMVAMPILAGIFDEEIDEIAGPVTGCAIFWPVILAIAVVMFGFAGWWGGLHWVGRKIASVLP